MALVLGRAFTAVIANSVNLLAPQMFALVALDATSFGAFSAIALIGSIFTALAFALSVDPFLRASGDVQVEYFASASIVYILLGGISAITAFFVSSLLFWHEASLPTLVAIALYPLGFVLWNAQRIMLLDLSGQVVSSDMIGLLVTLVGLVGLGARGVTVGGICAVAGASYGLMSLHAGWISRLWWRRPISTIRWFAIMRFEIRAMALDTTMGISANSLGPLMLMPVLGTTGFGVYRSVGNLAAPFRSIISPMRSHLARVSRRKLHGRSGSVVQLGFLAGVSTLVFIALRTASSYVPDDSTLAHVARFAIPVGLIVALNGVWQVYMNRGRMLLPPTALFSVRVSSSALAATAPLLGALVAGLNGAMGALLISTSFQCFLWWRADRADTR